MSLPAPYADLWTAAPRRLRIPAVFATTGIVAVCLMSVTDLVLVQFAAVSLTSAGALAFNGISLAVYLLAAISFIFWLYQASANLRDLGRPMRWSPGWAIGAWFIPIANLFIVPRVVREIDRETVFEQPGIAVGWVTTWTANVILIQIYNGAEVNSLGFAVLVTAVEMSAGIFAILLIQRITRGHEHIMQPRQARTTG